MHASSLLRHLFCVTYLLSSVALSPALAGEPDDTIAQATPTGIAGTGCFSSAFDVDSSTDVDLFAVDCDADTHLSVLVSGGDVYVRVFSFDPNNVIVAELAANSELTDRGGDAGASVSIATAGTYYVGVSGEGNDSYDPVTGGGGVAGATGSYSLQVGVGADGGFPTPEVNDSIDLATLPTNTGSPGAYFADESGMTDDGPWGDCFGDADYFLVSAAALTPGNVLVAELLSGFGYIVIYETDGDAAGTPATFANVVAVRNPGWATLATAVINPGVNYAVLIQRPNEDFFGVGLSPRGWASLNYVPHEPTSPGTGTFGPSPLRTPEPYQLQLMEMVDPGTPGPFEPNDSLAQAAANALITLTGGDYQSAAAYTGDGRWGWASPIGVNADADFFALDGLSPGDTLEIRATPTPASAASLFTYLYADDDDVFPFAIQDMRLVHPSGGISSQLAATVDAAQPYTVLVSPEDSSPVAGTLPLPWDVNVPGTLLHGDSFGEYELAVRSLPPLSSPPLAGSRMWGAFRGALSDSIVEFDPATGSIVNTFALGALDAVNGACTGLAYARTPPGQTADVLYYLNQRGGASGTVRIFEYDADTGLYVAPGPGVNGTNLNSDTFISGPAGISVNDLRGGTDGLGYAGTKLWMTNQNTDKLVRWNTATRGADAFINFTDSPFNRQCRDGLEGTDQASIGSGSVLYVAAREDRVIVIVDVGTAGRGPDNDGVFTKLAEFDDPTVLSPSGIANTGGIAVLGCRAYLGDINGLVTTVVDDCGGGPANLAGFMSPDFGAAGLTGFFVGIAGDFDGDGDVDLADFALFAQCFGGPNNPPAPGCPPGVDADFDDDGDVDLTDFATFAQNFTGSL